MTKVLASATRAYPELADNFKGPFAPCEVAMYIVGATTPDTVPRLGPTKLNKLVYISHGWLLGKHQRPLVSEEAEVWEYGPVYRSIYDKIACLNNGNDRIPERHELAAALDATGNGEAGGIYACAEAIHLDYICEYYGGFEARQLIDMTYSPGSPWDVSLSTGNRSISDKMVLCYYRAAFKQ